MPAQPETERYLNHVADKFDLRRDIRFSTRVSPRQAYDEAAHCWQVRTDTGERVQARFLITAIGVLSAPYTPDFAGRDSFTGLSFHTGQWPKESLDFSDKRVCVIGTGATAVPTHHRKSPRM